jgi:hypothetical protein
VLHLSYSEVHGQFVRDDALLQPGVGMPQLKLNERNAIMLNCKDEKKFHEIYEKTIQRHFAKQARNPKPVLEIPRPPPAAPKE